MSLSSTLDTTSLGAMQDLDEVIVLNREALGLRSKGQPDRSMSLSNLTVGLSWTTRCYQLGAMQDLVPDREALNLRPKRHPDRSTSLSNLALHLSTRCDKLGAMQDLGEAILLNRSISLSKQPCS